jgi:hypothetical protein
MSMIDLKYSRMAKKRAKKRAKKTFNNFGIETDNRSRARPRLPHL